MKTYQITLFEQGTGNTRVIFIRAFSAEDAKFIAEHNHCQVTNMKDERMLFVQHIEAYDTFGDIYENKVIPERKQVRPLPSIDNVYGIIDKMVAQKQVDDRYMCDHAMSQLWEILSLLRRANRT